MPRMIGAVAGFTIGAALAGQRLSVWALVPVSLLTAIFFAFNWGVDQTIAATMLRFLTICFPLQIGFLVGAMLLALADKRRHASPWAHQQAYRKLKPTAVRRSR